MGGAEESSYRVTAGFSDQPPRSPTSCMRCKPAMRVETGKKGREGQSMYGIIQIQVRVLGSRY